MKTRIHTLIFFLLVTQICFAQGTWTHIGNMPEIRLCHTADEINGKIYIVGGGNTEQDTLPTTMLICDSLNGSWTQDTLPNNIYRSFHTSCVIEGNLYIIGGIIPIGGIMNSTNEMWMYIPNTGQWISKPSMPTHRLNLDCAVVNGKIYVMGGMQVNNGIPNNTDLNVLEVYDIASGTWSTGPNMTDGRWGHKAIAFNGKIYVFGGNLPVYLSTVEVYDPQGSWTLLNTMMPTGRYQFTACLLDTLIYTIDGWYHSANGPIYNKVEAYDPIHNVWITENPMPAAVGVSDGFTLNGKIYVFGGSYTTHPLIGTSDIYEFTPPHFSIPPGTYTIGSGGNFATIQDAFNKLSTDGVAGNVTLELIDNSYTAPAGQYGFLLNGPIPGAGPNSRVTIKPAATKNVIIEGSGQSVLYFLNTSYLTLDGVEVTGSTTLTLHANLNNQYAGNDALSFIDNSDHNIVRHTSFISDGFQKLSTGILFFPATSFSETPDSNLIENNVVKKAGVGIYVGGKNQNIKAVGNIIRGNMVGSEADSLISWGIQDENSLNSIIEDNLVQNINQQFNLSIITPGLNSAFSSGIIIRNNIIHNVRSSNLYGSTGILISGDAGVYGVNNLVYNNMVYDIQSTSTDPNSRVAGIQLWYQTNPKIYYNSVYLSGTGGINPGGSAALFITSAGTVTNLDVKNNIFVNTRDESSYCASAICDYSSAIFNSDYNDLYYTSNGNNCLVKIGNTNYLTLQDWQATGKDLHSITEMPNFIAPDLHINENNFTLLDGGAIPEAGIETDIDGDVRNVTIPDIGADEFDVISGVEDGTTLPTEFVLSQNFPNPFNPSTTIKYSIPQASQVQIKVFDVLGKEIEVLVNEEKQTGTYELIWYAVNLPSGVYFYQLKAGDYKQMKKMILMK